MNAIDSPRVLVTGASGFVGQHLCASLVARGCDVHSVSYDSDRTPPGTTSHAGDVCDAKRLAHIGAAVAPDLVFHLAGLHGGAAEVDREESVRVNVEGTRNIAAATPHARRLVFLSSAAVIDGRGQYAATKREAERVVLEGAGEAAREVVVLRASTLFGPGDRSERLIPYVMRSLAQGRQARLSAGTARRDYVLIQDAVTAIIRAGMERSTPPARILDLCSGTLHTVRDIALRAARAVAPDRMHLLEFGARPQGDHEATELPQACEPLRTWLALAPSAAMDDALALTAAWVREDVGVGAA